MLMPLLSLALAALSLGFVVDAHIAGHHPLRHRHELARRASSDVQLHKRLFGARWTFYDVGLGACGKWSLPTDYMVALNAEQFGYGFPGPNCFKSITMTYGGQTVTAVILDKCLGCPFGGLDLSPGLFEVFAPQSNGVIYGSWFFNDGSDGGGGGGGGDDAPPFHHHHHHHHPIWAPPPSPPPPPPPSPPPPPPPSPPPSSTHSWTPLPIWTPSTTAEIKVPTTWTPTSSSSSSSATSSTKAIVPNNGAPSGSTISTGSGTVNVTKPQNIDHLNALFINLGMFIVSTRSTA